jgi:hypothetical protein
MATRNGPDDPRCRDCPNARERKPGGGLYARCDVCRKLHRERAAVSREERKAKRECVVCRAKAAPNRNYTRDPKRAPTSTLCKAHQRYYAERRP